MGRRGKILTAVDIGTSKIRLAIGRIEDNTDNIAILGYAERNVDREVCKAEITDANKVRASLNAAIRDLEKTADQEIDPNGLYIGVSGGHIEAVNSEGSAHVDSPDGTVHMEHLEEAARGAKNLQVHPDRMVLNTIDGNFMLDNNRPVAEPLNQIASKVRMTSHIIHGDRNRTLTIRNILAELGFPRSRPVFNGLASALAVCRGDDFTHGALVIDIGAGVTDYMLFHNDIAMKSGVLAIGGAHLANDLSLGLDVDFQVARKLLVGDTAGARKGEGYSTIEIAGSLQTRQIPIASVETILEARVREILEIVAREIGPENRALRLNNGVILCGGVSRYPAARDIAASVFDTPVRIGAPQGAHGPDHFLSDPGALTTIGLLRFGERETRPHMGRGAEDIARVLDDKLWSMCKNLVRSVRDGFHF